MKTDSLKLECQNVTDKSVFLVHIYLKATSFYFLNLCSVINKLLPSFSDVPAEGMTTLLPRNETKWKHLDVTSANLDAPKVDQNKIREVSVQSF